MYPMFPQQSACMHATYTLLKKALTMVFIVCVQIQQVPAELFKEELHVVFRMQGGQRGSAAPVCYVSLQLSALVLV